MKYCSAHQLLLTSKILFDSMVEPFNPPCVVNDAN